MGSDVLDFTPAHCHERSLEAVFGVGSIVAAGVVVFWRCSSRAGGPSSMAVDELLITQI